MNCFLKDQSFSDFLYSTKRKTYNGNSNSGRRSTFGGNIALSPSDVIDFALLLAQRLLAGSSFIVTNESALCWGKKFSYITILLKQYSGVFWQIFKLIIMSFEIENGTKEFRNYFNTSLL